MQTEAKLIKCGDTEFCNECETWAKTDKAPKTFEFLHLNKLGRCDFYQGPSEERRHIGQPH